MGLFGSKKWKDEILEILEESSDLYGEDRIPYQKKILSKGDEGLKTLKHIALDKNIDVNIRKDAVCYIAKFPGEAPAMFIAENFVNGKNPSLLYAAYQNGEDQTSLPLFRQAKECLEELGYSVG